jgi:hypothetical protein
MMKTLTAHVAASDSALRHAAKEDELRAYFPAMLEVRPDLQEPQLFVAACQRMEQDGYRIPAAWEDDAVVAIAEYRLQENLVCGRFLYVNDLIVRASARRHRCWP